MSKIQLDLPHKDFAVALSGGGDSMALAHMACKWAKDYNIHVHLLHVNHNLRDEALAEAHMLTDWVADYPKARYHILTWQFDARPESGLMEKARRSRYALMADYCDQHDIQTICVAHHADDQLETFLFRLAKGSGLDGLTGMETWLDYNENLKIYRPLLEKTHGDLIAYCETHDLQWIEDPSNKDEKYSRPRLRKVLAEEGLDAKRFARTLKRLNRGKQALDWITDQVVANVVNEQGIEYERLTSYPADIQIRVLQQVLMEVGGNANAYPPKLERVEEIIETLRPGKSATLYGCVLSLSKDGKTLEVKGA